MSVQQPKQYNTSVIIKLSNVTDPTYSNGQLVTAILQSDEYVLRVLEKEGLVKDLSEVEKIKKGLNIVLITKDGNIFNYRIYHQIDKILHVYFNY
jgi:hypothetical protein